MFLSFFSFSPRQKVVKFFRFCYTYKKSIFTVLYEEYESKNAYGRHIQPRG